MSDHERYVTLWIFGTSAFNTVVRWHKLCEVEKKYTSEKLVLFAIFVPKISAIGRNLTKFWQKMFEQFLPRNLRGLGIACSPFVRPSVTLVDCDHIGWKSWKLIARTISPAPSLFVSKRRSTYSEGNMGKFWGDYRGGVGKKWRAGEQKRQYLWNA